MNNASQCIQLPTASKESSWDSPVSSYQKRISEILDSDEVRNAQNNFIQARCPFLQAITEERMKIDYDYTDYQTRLSWDDKILKTICDDFFLFHPTIKALYDNLLKKIPNQDWIQSHLWDECLEDLALEIWTW